MDVMRTGCSILGCIETEANFLKKMIKSTECLRYFHQLLLTGITSHENKKINTETDDDTIGSFLSLLHGEKPSVFILR